MPRVNGASVIALERSKFSRIGIIVVVILAVLGGLLIFDSQKTKKCDLKISSNCYSLEYARTSVQQNKGLGGRKSLSENSGMLFVFQQPAIQYFWMKDMSFDLDIIWLNDKKEIVGIEKYVKPDTYPDKFTAEKPAMYVLEFNAGFSDKNHLKLGQRLNF